MRIKSTLLVLLFLALCFPVSQSRGATVDLYEYAYNIDGTVSFDSQPAGVNGAGFNYTTGLGGLSLSITGTGSHFVGFYVDHEIDQLINTYFNEFGTAVGVPSAGLSWEIDEPGYVFGDIYTHFSGSTPAASLLDNSNGVPSGSPDDVSMALGWNFVLLAGQTATINFSVSTTPPASGFYLQQTDPNSEASIYFSTAESISGTGGSVPDGGATLAFLFMSVVTLMALNKMPRLSACKRRQSIV